jgi:hypothetical protein
MTKLGQEWKVWALTKGVAAPIAVEADGPEISAVEEATRLSRLLVAAMRFLSPRGGLLALFARTRVRRTAEGEEERLRGGFVKQTRMKLDNHSEAGIETVVVAAAAAGREDIGARLEESCFRSGVRADMERALCSRHPSRWARVRWPFPSWIEEHPCEGADQVSLRR